MESLFAQDSCLILIDKLVEKESQIVNKCYRGLLNISVIRLDI